MAEGRMLSKRISRSNKVAALKSDTARLIYTWLIPYLDVEGRMEANCSLLKADLAPLLKHITVPLLQRTLTELNDIGLIILYTIGDKQYLELTQFNEHQKNLRKDREAKSKIPVPPPAELRQSSGEAPAVVPHKIKLREDNINRGAAEDIPEWIPKEQWNGFVFMRKEIKKPLTGRAIKIAISTLLDLKNRGHDPGRVLDQSTMAKWHGLFELKTGGGNGKRPDSQGGPGIPREYKGEAHELSDQQRAANVKRLQQLKGTIATGVMSGKV